MTTQPQPLFGNTFSSTQIFIWSLRWKDRFGNICGTDQYLNIFQFKNTTVSAVLSNYDGSRQIDLPELTNTLSELTPGRKTVAGEGVKGELLDFPSTKSSPL
jgi:hypothetical protein